MKIALIKEGKTPPDSRVPMIPEQCAHIQKEFPFEIVVQPSPNRCFSDQEYLDANVRLQEQLDDCDILMGVKEVPVDQLIPDKTYFFFSHTIKKQSYNRKLLQSVLEKKIRLIDYEVLTDDDGRRLIAFGRFAGMVGAHNALYTYGERTGLFSLKRMKDCHDYEEAKRVYQKIKFPPVKIVLTGTGRVGSGAAEVLLDMGITQVSPEEFLSEDNHEPVFTQLACSDYAARKNGGAFNQDEFYRHPEHFKSIFTPYYEVADIMINGIYWDNKAPAFFSREDMRQAEFQIQVIADVTCDIAPVSSIPSTLKASTIEHPVFGYDPHTGAETQPYQPDAIDMMTIDNLPNELPRDASTAFGQQFIEHILHELVRAESDILERATIARDGKLTERYEYLSDYVSKHE